MTSYGSSSTEKKEFTTTGPTEVKATTLPGETTTIKTNIYSSGTGTGYSGGGAGYTADLGDRTEGNQNWMETGGELRGETQWSEKAREVGHEASDKARSLGYAAEQKASSATQTAKDTAARTGEVLKEKWEQGKEKVSEAMEVGKEKMHEAMEAGKEKYAYGKEKAAEQTEVGKEKLAQTWEQGKAKMGEAMESGKEKLEYGKERATYEAELGKEKMGQMYQGTKPESSHGMLERVKETVGTATHNIAESLEHAREKAREVFTGASPYGKEGSYLKTDQPVTEVTVKTEPASGAVNRVQVDSNTETKIQ